MAPLVQQIKEIVQDIEDIRNAEVEVDMDMDSIFGDESAEAAAESNAVSCSAAVGHRQVGAKPVKMRRLVMRSSKKQQQSAACEVRASDLSFLVYWVPGSITGVKPRPSTTN